MSDEIVLYTHPMSRGRIARWMLEEIGAPYRTEIVDYGPPMKAAEYRAINPLGKVPAIRHGDAIITETGAICAYLADAFPEAGLAPAPGSKARGTYYRWLFFTAGPFDQVTTARTLGWQVPDGKEGLVGSGGYGEVLDALEDAVTRSDYLAGTFSAADIYVGAHIGWAMRSGQIEKRPAFESYLAKLIVRPAWQKAQDIDNALTARHPMPAM